MSTDQNNIMTLDKEYIANSYARFPINLVQGKGVHLYDEKGKEYIDFTSGIGVNSIGYADEGYVQAVTDQVGKLAHMSNLFYTNPQVELAQILTKRTNMKKVFFCNSGTEANEGAIKVARKYAYDKYQGKRNEIIALNSSFHGRTMGSISATGQDVMHPECFAPYLEGFVFADANLNDLNSKITDKTAAIMIEIIQGEGGVIMLDEDFVKGVAKICQKQDILLVVDEVQTGMGRTGKLLASEHFGITPDIVTLAKGLAGGLPIGAVLMGEKTHMTLGAGNHGSTFGGNLVVCAAAKYVLEKIDDNLIEQVAEKGAYFKEKLEKIASVKSVSGKGFMIGIELKESCFAGDKTVKDIIIECMEKGILVLSAKNKIRLLPPLIVDYPEIDKGFEVLAKVLNK